MGTGNQKVSVVTPEKRQSILEALHQSKSFTGKQYPIETEDAIVYACNCDDEDLRKEAIAFVLVTNQGLFSRWIRDYGVTIDRRYVDRKMEGERDDHRSDAQMFDGLQKMYRMDRLSTPSGGHELEEFYSEIYLMLYKTLPNWDPAKGKLSTHLKGPFHEVMQNVMRETGLPETKYGNKQEQLIQKAVTSLKAKGISAPTILQIQEECLRTATTKTYVPTTDTIQKTMKLMARTVVPYDPETLQITASKAADPVYNALVEDEASRIHRAINCLPERSRVIMQAYYGLLKSGEYEDGEPTSAEILHVVQLKIPSMTSAQFHTSFHIACTHFRQAVKSQAFADDMALKRATGMDDRDYVWHALEENTNLIQTIGVEEYFRPIHENYRDEIDILVSEA